MISTAWVKHEHSVRRGIDWYGNTLQLHSSYQRQRADSKRCTVNSSRRPLQRRSLHAPNARKRDGHSCTIKLSTDARPYLFLAFFFARARLHFASRF
jgi:hypothetical protein